MTVPHRLRNEALDLSIFLSPGLYLLLSHCWSNTASFWILCIPCAVSLLCICSHYSCLECPLILLSISLILFFFFFFKIQVKCHNIQVASSEPSLNDLTAKDGFLSPYIEIICFYFSLWINSLKNLTVASVSFIM